VYEEPASVEGKPLRRFQVRVQVRAQPEEPPSGRHPQALRDQAVHTMGPEPPQPPGIVRRYRREPSPLVRDRARGWRTGRLDAVLGGDFDLLGGEAGVPTTH